MFGHLTHGYRLSLSGERSSRREADDGNRRGLPGCECRSPSSYIAVAEGPGADERRRSKYAGPKPPIGRLRPTMRHGSAEGGREIADITLVEGLAIFAVLARSPSPDGRWHKFPLFARKRGILSASALLFPCCTRSAGTQAAWRPATPREGGPPKRNGNARLPPF